MSDFSTNIFRTNLSDRFLSIQRGDLARIVYDKIENRIETIFGESITRIVEVNDKVHVSFENSAIRSFDLVIGADGLHSQVRTLTFGPSADFEMNLGYYAAAFSADNYQPRDPDVYVSHSVPGKQLARFALRNNRTVFFLIFSNACLAGIDCKTLTEREMLEKVFSGVCVESDAILDAMKRSSDLYFDKVSQIRMPTWSRGRIALVGDAAACPSLLAGQGASLAMAASFILAGELKGSEDYGLAFKRYEDHLKDFIVRKQLNAEKFGRWFAPETNSSIFIRNQITKLFGIPFIAKLFVSDMIADQKQLPDYG